jgi:hypothetical protein
MVKDRPDVSVKIKEPCRWDRTHQDFIIEASNASGEVTIISNSQNRVSGVFEDKLLAKAAVLKVRELQDILRRMLPE